MEENLCIDPSVQDTTGGCWVGTTANAAYVTTGESGTWVLGDTHYYDTDHETYYM